MSFIFNISFIFLLMASLACAQEQANIVPGRLLFKLKDVASTSSKGIIKQDTASAPAFLRKVSLKSLQPLFPEEPSKLAKVVPQRKSRLDNIFIVDLSSTNESVFEKALKLCQNDPDVEFCQPSYIYTSDGFPQDDPPNDPKYTISQVRKYFDYMNFNNQSWSKSMGEGIVVAVLDTAFFPDHQDLQENVWLNKGEFAASVDSDKNSRITLDELITAGLTDTDQNGIIQLKDLFGSSFEDHIDNDGNGNVDDFMGWSFFNSSNNNYKERYEHATSVMSVVAAVGNNNKVSIGAAPKSQIMMIQVGADTAIGSGRGTESETAGLHYAVSNGANVINYSRGGGSPNDWVTQAAIQDAIDQGVVFVASAGNSNRDVENHFPAKYSEAISIGAIATGTFSGNPDWFGSRYSSSNYGEGICVWAIGEEIAVAGIFSPKSSSTASFTSHAAPFVSGAVAMLMSKNIREVPDENNPRRIKASEYKGLLKSTCWENGKVDHGVNICVLDALALVSVEPPLLSAIPDKEVSVGELLEFDVVATDENNNLVDIIIDGDVPQGATLISTETPSRKIFRWRPDSDTPNQYYTIRFKAIDKTGLKDIKSVKVKVKSANPLGQSNLVINSINLQNPNPKESTGYLFSSQPLLIALTLKNIGNGQAQASLMDICVDQHVGYKAFTKVVEHKCAQVSVPSLNPGDAYQWNNNLWLIKTSPLQGSINRLTIKLDVLNNLKSPVAGMKRTYEYYYDVYSRSDAGDEGAMVSGVVLDQKTSLPITNALIIFEDYKGSRAAIAMTDKNGNYKTLAIKSARYYIHVKAKGYASASTKKELVSGKNYTINFKLK